MTGMGLQVIRFFVGILISFLSVAICSLFTGDTDIIILLTSVFVFSIICTLGFSLVFWIPLFWIIGYFVLEVAGLFNRLFGTRGDSGARGTGGLQAIRSVQTDTQAIVSYINQSRVHGASDQQITTRLRSKGWTDSEVNHAFQQASAPRNES